MNMKKDKPIDASIKPPKVKFFASPEDRDKAFVMGFLFIAFFFVVALFRDRLSTEIVAGMITAILTAIATVVHTFFKDFKERKQDNLEVKTPKKEVDNQW